MRLNVCLVILLIAFPMVEAVGISGGSYSAVGSNITVSFAGLNATASQVSVPAGAGFVVFSNLTINGNCGSVTMPLLNISWANSFTYATSFPSIGSCPSNALNLVNGLNISVNATVNASADGLTPSLPQVTYANGSSEVLPYSFAGGAMSLHGTFPAGNTSVRISDLCGLEGSDACVYPGYAGGGGGGGIGTANSTNLSTSLNGNLSNITNQTVSAGGAPTGSVVLEGDNDLFVLGGIFFLAFVLLVVGTRRRS